MAKRKHLWQKTMLVDWDYICLNCGTRANVCDGRAKFEGECVVPKVFEMGRGARGLKWKDQAAEDQAQAIIDGIKESRNK